MAKSSKDAWKTFEEHSAAELQSRGVNTGAHLPDNRRYFRVAFVFQPRSVAPSSFGYLFFIFYCWQRYSSDVTNVSTPQKRFLCWDKRLLVTSKQAETRYQSALNRASADWFLSRGRNIFLRRDWLKPWWWIWVSLGNSSYSDASSRGTQPS